MAAHSFPELALNIEEMTEDDIPALTAVMTRAFDDDSQRHLGQPQGGPEGYDTGDFFRTWVFGYQHTRGYKVSLSEQISEQIVGGFIVWDMPDGHNYLGTVFVDPSQQHRGIGAAIWRYIEQTFPAQTWTLETPTWATSNHRFYTLQCGFTRVGEKEDSVVYRKVMPQPA